MTITDESVYERLVAKPRRSRMTVAEIIAAYEAGILTKGEARKLLGVTNEEVAA